MPRSYIKGGAECQVDACEARASSKGYCPKHYKRWRKHGTVAPRFRAEVVNGSRVCAQCKQDRPLADWGASSYCKPCCRDNARKYAKQVARNAAACAVCGTGFQATKRQSVTCSESCRVIHKARSDSARQKANREKAREANRRWRAANLAKVAEKEARRRARKRGATVGEVDIEALWTGLRGICGEAIDLELSHPDPMSRSLDHIQPLAKGGAHTQGNLQWAHLICNVRKGDRQEASAA